MKTNDSNNPFNNPFNIPFNIPFLTESIAREVSQKIAAYPLGNPDFLMQLTRKFHEITGISEQSRLYFTQSATQALEMMALSLELEKGDEVILPSYTYAATANAFARTGATLIFSDVAMETVNITAETVSPLITKHTKAIIPIHYGGIAANMKAFQNESFAILEDAAHGVGATYEGKALGTMGEMGCLSFHHTKNITAGGSGGVLIVSDPARCEAIDEIFNQGTDRLAFLDGKTATYKWRKLGGEFGMTPYAMLFLAASLDSLQEVTHVRRKIWQRYQDAFSDLKETYGVHLPMEIEGATGNGHNYYLILPDPKYKEGLKRALQMKGIEAYSHYEPLHQSVAGKRYGQVRTAMTNTENISRGLIRLPIFYTMTVEEQDRVIDAVLKYFYER